MQRLVDVVATCGMKDNLLADDGASLSVIYMGEGSGGNIERKHLVCLYAELDTPHHVRDHIGATRALDGMREDEWNDIKARWTYHPDDGLRLTLIDQQA